MTPRIYRALSVICFLLAVAISIMNLKRTMNLGLKTIPLAIIVLGIIMSNRAKKARQSNTGN